MFSCLCNGYSIIDWVIKQGDFEESLLSSLDLCYIYQWYNYRKVWLLR